MSSFPLNPIKETDPSIALTLDVLQRYVQNLFQANPLTISDERPLTTGAEAISLLLGKQLSAESDMLCALPEFIATKSVVWPATIRHACESSVQDNTVFLLENISRVAIRIQHKLILWNFLTGSDMKVIEEPEPVQNIFTVRTPLGLLNSNSTHLLLLIFCGKVSVYGLSFADRAIPGEYEFQGRKGSRCHVTPCTITDLGISQISEFTIQKIVQHDFTDRIFFAAQEGDFYEIHLVKDLRTDSLRMTFTNLDAFFSQQNYVSQCIGSLLTKAYLSVIKKEQALDICVDSFRHQIFVLHLDSSITMYSISEGGKGQISLICTKKHEPGMLQHLNTYRDPKLSPLSSVHIGGPREDFALVSVASNGYCYFYSLQESGFTGGKQLEVKKVFCSLDNDSREFRKSWFETEKQIAFSYVSNGIGAFIRTCSSESNQSENTSPPNVSSAMLMDEICFTSSSREVSLNANENTSLERPTVTIFPQRGSELQDMRMLYVGEIDHTVFASLCKEIASATPIQETDSQYILPSRRFAVVTNTGVHFVRKLRPLDILFLVISSGRTTSARSILARFQSTFGLEEFCSMLCLLYGKLASAHEFSELTLSLRKAQSECVSCSSRILSEKEISTFIWEILESRLLPDSASLVALDANYISGRDLTMSTFSQSRNTLFCITTSPAIRGLRLLFSRILLSLVPLRLFSPSSPSRPRPGLHLTEEDLRGVLEILTPLAHVLSTLRKQGWMEPNPSLPLFWENNDQFDTILSVPSNHTGLSSSHLKQLVALQLSSLEHTTHIVFQFLSLLQMVQTTKYEPVLIDTAATEYTRLSSQHSTPPLPYFHDLVFGDLLLSPSAPSVRLPVVRALLRSFLRVPDLTPAELSTLNSTMATKCPSLLPAEDFAEYHAQLLLRECHRSWGNDPAGANDKINDLVKALLPLSRHLWQSCGLRAIAEVLWEMKGYAAVASLCWSAAAQGDGKREAMGAYLYGIDPENYVQPSGRAQEALEDRWQCYGLLVSFLEQGFAGENSTTLNSSLRELFEVESGRIGSLWNLPGCDLLAKYFLLEWMLQRESSDPMREYFLQIVLRMPPGDLEKFLELHQSMFGRERALFYIKQDRSEDALRAFLSAATSRFVNSPGATSVSCWFASGSHDVG